MVRKLLLILTLAATAGEAPCQIRVPALPILRGKPPAQPVLVGIDAWRADFAAQSGGTTVYFGGDSSGLGAPARAVLTAQAAWLRRHPAVVVRIEGHADPSDTRDHALAIGARRAEAVRSYLILLGVPAAQVSAVSWGKERPGAGRTVTVLVR